ncbi:MAG: virulence factor [Hydrotalea sp.]|nr:virulence factor [Hydrotalea sp.]
MAQYQIIFWRDIPSQVIVSAGGRRGTQVKKQLSERFEKAIDRAAMAGKADATDDYLAEWKKSAPVECGDDLEKIASDLAADLEKNYPAERLDALIDSAGYDKK